MTRILRGVLKTLIILLVVVLLLPVLLYVPFIQDYAVGVACRKVSESTGMKIEVGSLRLKWPLRLSLDNVTAIEAGGDTLARLGGAEIAVGLMPLLHGEAVVNSADIKDVYYRMGTPDSIMYLTVNARQATVSQGSSFNFKENLVDVESAELDGGRVKLVMKDSTDVTPQDTSSVKNAMIIRAGKIVLRDVSYEMTMLPVIDSLGAHVDFAELLEGHVDLGRQLVNARSLKVDSVTATYLTPSLEYLKIHPADSISENTESAPDSALWTVTADSVRLTARSATYAMRGAKPLPGLDMNYLSASKIRIAVDSVFNRGASVGGYIKELKVTERCGLEAGLRGRFDMDTASMRATGMEITLQRSAIKLDALMGIGDLMSDPNIPLMVKAKGFINSADAALAMPMIKAMTSSLPKGTDLRLTTDISGTSGRIKVNDISARLGNIANLSAKGTVSNAFNPAKISGRVSLDGNLRNANVLKPTLLDAQLAKTINIPPTRLTGSINYSPGAIDGRLTATTGGGKIAADGNWHARGERYQAAVTINRFPVNSIMPGLGVGDVTATINAKGHGYNPLLPTTSVDLDIDIPEAVYMNKTYDDVRLTAHLSNGEAEGELVSNNRELDLDAEFTATVDRTGYTWDVNGEVRHIDLQAMNLSATPMSGSVDLFSQGSMSTDMSLIDGIVKLTDLDWEMGEQRLRADTVDLKLQADSAVNATLTSGDLLARATAHSDMKQLLNQIAGIPVYIDSVLAKRSVDIIALEQTLPQMELAISAGRKNLLNEFLAQSKTGFNRATITFTNDSMLHMAARVEGMHTGDTRLDSIRFDANQKGKYLIFSAALNQRPGTMDQFAHVGMNGFISSSQLSMLVKQRNIQGKQGYFIGMNVTASDSTLDVRFVPGKPTIAYKQWRINQDNFVTLNTKHPSISANLQLSNDEDSYLKLYTLNETENSDQEDVVLQLNKIKIQDWISINPFAPPIKGDVGANMRFHLMPNGITGKGTADINELYYGKERVGTFGLDLDVSQSRGGVLNADLGLMVDSVKVITAQGSLNDSTKTNPFLLDFSMIKFPLAVANPFLPKEYARLSGTLNGNMEITGTMTEPIFNGYLSFDSAACKVGMLGSTLSFPGTHIPVDSNIVHFNNFAIKAVNQNPLTINGTVDARKLINPVIDLSLNASEMQIVGSTRPRGADVYGKAFIDLEANVKGNMNFMNINADLDVLPGTNVTYILGTDASEIVSQSSGDMVQFVVFADSAMVAQADSITQETLNMNLEANLKISEGSTINVDLSTDGSNKVSIQGAGNLTYTQNPMNDGRLTGRFNINKGFVRYTPPLMSEKLFNFEEGSYVSFTGDMMNPILNVHAVDNLKANVTQSGQDSRLVNFEVSLAVTNTLQNMNVAFDLSTNDDLTVQNELSSMSPQQRANQAMNLLLYNVYTGAGTRGNANLSGNPLYSFLEGRLNSWAANNIKGVDLSFGIDQYDKTTNGSTSTATSYSYKVSKTLFNDRVKIIVGGNYSTDANADENFEQNLVNDISFEYMLNRSGSMYIRVFRHVGYESILEGEITQTGVGFVMKRKLNTLRNLFKFLPSHKPKAPEPEPTETSTKEATPITKTDNEDQ